jgi:outer membrane protein assembly factor BamB
MAISADGSKPGSGILWETTGNRSDPKLPATLHAFDAGNLANEIWNSNMTGGADSVGMFAKFANPTVADGKVFVPTWSGTLTVYGLRNSERGKGRR